MDKETIKGKKVYAVVEFDGFIFNPCLKKGKHEGYFILCAWSKEKKKYFFSPRIVDIFEVNGVIYIETTHVIFPLDEYRNFKHLENVKKYLVDKEYSSSEFCNDCITKNTIRSKYGWRII